MIGCITDVATPAPAQPFFALRATEGQTTGLPQFAVQHQSAHPK